MRRSTVRSRACALVVAVALLLGVGVACDSGGGHSARRDHGAAGPTRTPGTPRSSDLPTGSSPDLSPGDPAGSGGSGSPTSGRTTSGPAGSRAPTGPSGSPSRPPLRGSPSQRTPGHEWWGVDSTVAMDEASLANVQQYYVGGQTPLVWGRYIDGSFALHPGELAFARAHGIYVYLLVPDANCSVCDGGNDVCGNDSSAQQAHDDAVTAVLAAQRAAVPPGTILFKDVEQVGSCAGELTDDYLYAWFRTLQHTRYRAGFYGNATSQDWDFPRAYCAMIAAHPPLARRIVLADDEPEPAISAPPGSIGPGNAPPFAPDAPSCAPKGVTRIWQYGESTSDDNVTDVDEIRPDTPGLISPQGTATGR